MPTLKKVEIDIIKYSRVQNLDVGGTVSHPKFRHIHLSVLQVFEMNLFERKITVVN